MRVALLLVLLVGCGGTEKGPAPCETPTTPDAARPACSACYSRDGCEEDCFNRLWPDDAAVRACADECDRRSSEVCLIVQFTPDQLTCATDVPRYAASCYQPCPAGVAVGQPCAAGHVEVCSVWQQRDVCLAP